MAHRVQRRALRGDRHAAHGGVRALRRAALVLTAALAVAAPRASHARLASASHADLLASGAPDVPAWWSELGDPGWTPEADWGSSFPWTLAGHVRGGIGLVEPARAQALAPFPGVFGARAPIAWFDSLAVDRGPGAAWRGWDATLIEVRGDRGPAGLPAGSRPRARGDFTFHNGTSALEQYALGVQRGDSLGWLRAEASSWNRGGVEPLGLAGRHLWGFSAGVARGMHVVGGAVGQRGAADRIDSGEEQSVAGGSGHAFWEIERGGQALGLRAERSQAVHESFGGGLEFARRESEHERVELSWRARGARDPLAARLEWTRENVTRIDTARAGLEANAVWGALRGERRLGDGRIELGLGAGVHDAVDRFELVPSVAYAFATPAFDGRLIVERVLAPVWADLAPGQGPFLQSTWTAGLQIGGRSPALGGARLAWRMGRTRDRAVVARAPFEELWLRSGFRADPRRHDFGLLTAASEWRGRSLGAGAEGFLLARRRSPIQPLVDPGRGARAWAEGRARVFAGDLGVGLRLEAGAIGPRESEASPSRLLPGYVTLGLTATFMLADVVVTLQTRNLENERRPETWVDPLTAVEALGAQRETRFLLTWRLFN